MKVLSMSDAIRTESTQMVHREGQGHAAERVLREIQEPRTEQLWKEERTRNGKNLEDAFREDVTEAVETINSSIEFINRALRFSVHEDTQQMMVKVVDVLTDEVIKEIPPEDVLDTVARIREMIGLLIDERA